MKRFKWTVFVSIFGALSFLIFYPFPPSSKLLLEAQSELKKYKSEFPDAKYAILVDYGLPVFMKRLWVVKLETKEVVLSAHVSHAMNSGKIWATEFSNEIGSKISSKGTFKTLHTYESNYGKGEYKVGMRLKGLEKNKNDHVYKRNIVFHSSYGLWSHGCFITAPTINKKIIDLTKNGNILIVSGG